VSSRTETPKRYRYTGMERDEESGLNYHGARYYAPWLGRWTAADPAELSGGLDLFVYAHSNPVRLRDQLGTDPTPAVNLTQDEEGNYILPGEVIEIHDTAPPLTVDESYRRRRLADIATRDEFERQRNFRDWYFRPGHQKDDFDRAREAMWITDPEGTSERYYSQLNDEFTKYRDAQAADIRKGQRIIDASAAIAKGAAVVAIAATAVFTGGFALGANSASTIGGTTAVTAGSTTSVSLTATRIAQTVAANPVVTTAAAGGGATAVNEFAEEAPTLETALPAFETEVAEGEAFIGTNQQIAGYDIVGEGNVVGDTFKMTISGWFERVGESEGINALFNALRDRALAAGASRIEIIGALVENPRLNRMIELLAERYGFSFERISSSEFILRGLL
jgi:RHS repeat-associated protein